jgi:Uma2 family endonuclease
MVKFSRWLEARRITALISENFGREIGIRLKGKPCRVYDSNLRVGIPHTPRYMYPDKLVVCGNPEFDPRDKKNLSVTNPRLVVEVISDSSEKRDRGEKFTRYRKLDSLQEYVLVSQDRPQIEPFFRQRDGTWLLTPYHGLDAIVHLRSLEIEIPAAEIYEGVVFPPEEEPKESDEDKFKNPDA